LGVEKRVLSVKGTAVEELAGRTAVVTGGASGIGRAMARRFASARMNVVVADIDAVELDSVVRDLRDQGGCDAIAVRTDVTEEDDLHALAARAHEQFGPVHVLCNNAGIGGPYGLLSEIQRTDWERVLGVNLWGAIHGLRAFLPAMLAHGREGHIVNTVSASGLKPGPFVAPYAASKHALFGLTVALFHEMAIEGGRIGVSALCPGPVNTNAWKSIYNASPTGDDGGTNVGDALAAGIDPNDVAALVESAIRTRQLFVFTHQEWLDQVFAEHVRTILEQDNPSPLLSYGAGHTTAPA
jgi:NAD(P)-dependent dehydrogenase (short-subunit alcohol dehydrogenase family)